MAAPAERVLGFGPDQRLVGVLNHRAGDRPVACLLLNVGVTGRTGPRRLNVKMARALAVGGVTSLRLDLSGIGDSGVAEATSGYQQGAVQDLRAAMDAVESATGIHRFLVLGICSGAVNAYRVAQADERVVGIMMFDGYAFPTWRTRWIHNWQRLTRASPGDTVAKLARRTRRWLGLPVPTRPVSIFYASRDSTAPSRQTFGDVLDALAARGVQLLVVYSGSMLALYNHRSQFTDAFRGRSCLPAVQCHYLPHIDHIPTSQAAQTEFLDLVCGWVARHGD
jgi:hypothetical protein